MKITFCTVAALVMCCPSVRADTPQSQTSRIVDTANAFLKTLDQKQREGVLYKFDDDKQRARWSNLPTGFVPRGGIALRDLSEAQRTAAMELVASALSKRGLEKVQQIMGGDEALKTQPNNGPGQGRRGGGGGGPGGGGPAGQNGPMFGKDLYFISILGTPSVKDPWMLQFGGHHLALNITIIGEQGVLTPTLTCAQPALYVADGKTIRPLGQESDKAFALLDTLDEAQRKAAILNYRVADLVLGPGHDGQTIQPEGLKASAMNAKQREMLLGLISEWSDIVSESYAAPRTEQIKAGLDDTWFAWSGATTHEEGKGGTGYYRIQGPHLVIEYAPQSMGGDPTMHIHTMYRDPTNDYGRELIKK